MPLTWPPKWLFLKGLLETIFKEKSVFSGEAKGGIGGLIFTLVGDNLGGRLGGFSSCGEADLTVFTEAVEEIESELEVMLRLEGLMGDLLRSRSSELELSLPLTLAVTVLTGWCTACLAACLPDVISSSCEFDLTKLLPN